jgi:hypothetical protein
VQYSADRKFTSNLSRRKDEGPLIWCPEHAALLRVTFGKDYSVMIHIRLKFVVDTTGIDPENESREAGHLLQLLSLVERES